ncbi:methyl-accepting chemotaxis protein [Pelagibius sp. CAU 1746]|uniref:methyl-accepting chemotaxis protein n=1 Tax=Pelagibius sp. CAU 1746 TaxID=3140370 RepID=UPI00325B950A
MAVRNLLSKLQQFRISARIGLLSAISALSVIVLGGAYLFGDISLGSAFHAQGDSSHLAQYAQEVESGALQMRRAEKDFLIRKDMKYLERYEEATTEVLSDLDRMAALEVAASIRAEIGRLREGIIAHAEQFRKVAALQERIGLDEKSGLKGSLRAAVHAVETKLQEARLDALTVKMLMMRRHEKDFMLRGAEKYIGSIDERRQEFDRLLTGTPLSQSFKDEVSGLMDKYQADFHAFAEGSLELEAEISLLSDIFGRMNDDFDRAFSAAAEGLVAAEQSLEASRVLTRSIFLVIGVTVLVLAIGLGVIIGRSVSGPLLKMTETLKALAAGDTSLEVPSLENKDEIGDIARAVVVFKENAIERERLEAEQAAQRAANEKRAKAVEQLIADFDTMVGEALGVVSAASAEMNESADSMAKIAATTKERSGAATKAADSASSNVQMVAAAAEELHGAIGEIGRQVSRSTDISSQAKQESDRTSETMSELATAAEKIGAVVNLIQDIAEQTNLLALNATIEAARAGEAGKGFAVVASEVKTLANQTAKATEEISQQISAMQTSTGQAVTAIKQVNGTIDQIAEIATTISSAVEEQGAATQEIAKNVQEAAAGTEDVTRNITEVDAATGQTTDTAGRVSALSADLTTQAERLRREIETFLSSVKAA